MFIYARLLYTDLWNSTLIVICLNGISSERFYVILLDFLCNQYMIQ